LWLFFYHKEHKVLHKDAENDLKISAYLRFLSA